MWTEREAYDKGREHGANVGEWYFDGNTPEEAYAVVLRGIEDGDPEVLDTFPTFSFGEWGGESLIEIFGDEYRELEPEDAAALADEYLRGFDDGTADMIESTARNHLAESCPRCGSNETHYVSSGVQTVEHLCDTCHRFFRVMEG